MTKRMGGIVGIAVVLFATNYLFATTVKDNFSYRPYPVLLVHGFNTSVEGTWGILGKNDQIKTSNFLTTKFVKEKDKALMNIDPNQPESVFNYWSTSSYMTNLGFRSDRHMSEKMGRQ